MTENLFMLMTWALGQGQAAGRWPVSGRASDRRLAALPDLSDRRHRHVAVAALEQKFWDTFCDIIDLPEPWRDDRKDPAATIAEVRKIIAAGTAEEWKRRFHGIDCCCSVVLTLQEALGRAAFRHAPAVRPCAGERGRLERTTGAAGGGGAAVPRATTWRPQRGAAGQALKVTARAEWAGPADLALPPVTACAGRRRSAALPSRWWSGK
jgi:crotonobetainyl-CoA:carnitine CoA-transferase CaiB-like acyl-CoA transferase